MLNHVVKDVETHLVALLLVASEAAWDEVGAEGRDKTSDHVTVSLEKCAHELSSGDLEVILVGVFLLDEHQVIGVEHIILVLDLLVGEGIVLGDSLKGLVDDVDALLAEVGNLFLGHKAGACSLNAILEGLNLRNKSVGVELLLHSLVNVLVEGLGHGVESGHINVALLGSLHKAGQ